MGVGGVLAPERAGLIAHHGLPRRLASGEVVVQLVAGDVEQGTHHGSVAVEHAAEAARTGAHDGAHVEVLDAVVGGMGREDARLGEGASLVLAHRAQRLVGGQVALAPGHGFHVLAAALGFGSDVDGADEQRDVQRLGQSRHEALVGIGVLAAQLVVHVQHGHRSHIARLAQGSAQIRQRRGIGAAGHHEQHSGIGRHQVVSCDGGTGLFEGSFNQVSHFPFLLLATHRGRGAG